MTICIISFSADTSSRPLASQDGDKEAEEQESPQLRIAWQYRRYIQRQQLQQQSGLSSLHEDLATPGMPSLQDADLGRLTSAPTKGEAQVLQPSVSIACKADASQALIAQGHS